MKKHLGLIFIIALGLILRLIFIDKPDGLWNDEYVSWYISQKPFLNGFWQGIISQCHMPFYYIYLKIYTVFFGNSDIVLRVSSVIPGIIAIPIMYKVGNENDAQTGYFCATITAISAFLIYYSQEVRFYSLLFLFSAINLLYTLRIVKDSSKTNCIIYSLSNFLILITHTIGFVYVFFNLLFVSLSLSKKYKNIIITLWIIAGSILSLILPLIIKIFTTKSFSQWWGHFSISKLGFLLTDWFSPVITNLTNAPDKFIYLPKIAPFMIIPTTIAIFCIIYGIKSKNNLALFIISLSVIAVNILAAVSGRLVFLTKYSIEIYPILIFLACFGLAYIKDKFSKYTLALLYCVISLGFIFLCPYSAPKMHRAEGHKIPMEMIKRANIQRGDYIILHYYPKDRFEKYFDFSDYKVIPMDKGNFYKYISENNSYENVFENGKAEYKNIFAENNNKTLSYTLNNEISLQKGMSVILIILDSVSFYSPKEIQYRIQDETLYNKTPFLFLVFSYLKKETFEYLVKSLDVTQIERKGMWTLVKFTKLNN